MTLLVVLSAGPAAQVKALQADLAQPLARALEWTWDDRWLNLGPGEDPNRALQQLQPPGGEPPPGPGPVLVGLFCCVVSLSCRFDPIQVVSCLSSRYVRCLRSIRFLSFRLKKRISRRRLNTRILDRMPTVFP